MNELWVALIIAVVAPVVLSMVKARQDRKDKRLDWERQDLVASRLLDATAKTDGKLDVIHGLVNSTMTAAIQAELNSTRRELALLKENMSLRDGNGEDQPVTTESIRLTEMRIAEIEAILNDRLRRAT